MSSKDDQLYESVTTDDNSINNPFNALELDTLIKMLAYYLLIDLL